ncbi:MAG: hypothetical protein ABIO29_00175 [Sphingomicrobium sp.]
MRLPTLMLLAMLAATAPADTQPATAQPATAQLAPAPAPSAQAMPITVESYYRVKWGAMDEFKRLYERNEVTLLKEMQRQGLVTALAFEEPFTHLAAGPRWDFRARITYREAAAAVETGGSYDKAFAAAQARLLPDKARFDAEQAKRMGLLDDHWDVVVAVVEFGGK